MKRTIPQIRIALAEQAEKLRTFAPNGYLTCADDSRLHEIADTIDALTLETLRRSSGKRAKSTALKLTPELKERIREYVAEHHNMTNRAIGAHFHVDGGRVTDVMLGVRGE